MKQPQPPKYQNMDFVYSCKQNTDRMPMREGKRFCGKCQTSLHDFTTMSPEEITEAIRTSQGNLCAIFYADELEYAIERTGSLNGFRKWTMAGMAASLMAVVQPAFAQESEPVRTEQHVTVSGEDQAKCPKYPEAEEQEAEPEEKVRKRKPYHRRRRLHVNSHFPFVHYSRPRLRGRFKY